MSKNVEALKTAGDGCEDMAAWGYARRRGGRGSPASWGEGGFFFCGNIDIEAEPRPLISCAARQAEPQSRRQ